MELIHCGGGGRIQALSVPGCHCLLSVVYIVGPEAKFQAPFSHSHLYRQKMPFPGGVVGTQKRGVILHIVVLRLTLLKSFS